MSKRPIRVTGFTRFFLVMLLVAPLAYIGASYYNGEDGIQKIKDLFKIGKPENSTVVDETTNSTEGTSLDENKAPACQTLESENKLLKDELEFKSKRVDELYLENEALKRKLESAEKVLDQTKK